MNRPDYIRPFWCSIALILTLAGTCWAGLKQSEDAYGRGDYQKAAQAFHSAAEQGDAKAQYHLAFMYREGQGVPQDGTEAVKWFRKLAEQGRASAQYHLGVMYRAGRGVRKNSTQAAKWFRKSAEQGRAEAQIMLAAMHIEGRGVRQDYVRGHMWLNIAMSTGHKKAGEARAYIEMMMTPEQITEAHRLAGEWVNVHK